MFRVLARLARPVLRSKRILDSGVGHGPKDFVEGVIE
jgi:hypothetical protein